MRSRGRCSGSGRRAGLRALPPDAPAARRRVRRSRPPPPSSAAVSSSSASCSSSWSMSLAPRSEDWPNCSRRALASSSFRRSISSRGATLGLGDSLAPRLGRMPCRALGQDHRVRRGEIVGQRLEVCSQRDQYKQQLAADRLSVTVRNDRRSRNPQARLSPPPPAARSAAASASRSLRADSRAAPGDRHHTIGRRRPDEAAALQPLR